MVDEPVQDAVIAGAGVVGATLALALARGGMAVCVVDAAPLPDAPTPFDGRTTAVAAAPWRMLSALGLVAALAPHAQPITRMAVTDGPAPGASSRPHDAAALVFDAADAGSDEPLGWMVETRHLRLALTRALHEAGVTVAAPGAVADVEADGRVATLVLADGRRLAAPLLVGAEGRHSPVRKAVGVGVTGWDYGRSGLVATVRLERPHRGVAFQHFLPGGPLAVLPLTDDEDGRPRASVVWTERPAAAADLASASDAAFASIFRRRFGDILGAAEPFGPRFAHPLSLQLADRMIAPRTALAGDAAQVIHPLAGQGLNLGLKDVAALAEVVIEARRLGEDWGALAVLERYARWRRFDRMGVAAATDALHRLYALEGPGARLLRGLGVAAVSASAPVKRWLAQEASGASGDPPRLLMGLPV